MGIHESTLKTIEENSNNFTDEFKKNVDTIISLALDNSPLSDINFLLDKTGRSIPNICIPNRKYWLPIRNVIRIIAKLSQHTSAKIDKIELISMDCNCDSFTGMIKINLTDGKQITGNYSWKWTLFPGVVKNYDKFIEFPISTILIKK